MMNWYFITLSYLSMFVLGFADNLRGPLFFDILKHYNVSDTMGALFFSTSSTLGFLMSLASISILRRISYVRLLQWACLLMGLSLWSISQAQNFYMLLAGAGGLGSSMGFMGVCQNALVSQSPENIRSRALSGLHAMYGISSFLAPLAVSQRNHWNLTWNDYFMLTAIAPILLLAGTFKKRPVKVLKANISISVEAPKIKTGLLTIWLCGLIGFYVIAEVLVSTRLSLYSIREYGMASEKASLFVTGFFLGLLGGRILGMFIRWPGSYQAQLLCSLILSFISVLLGLSISPWFFSLTGFVMSVFVPICWAYTTSILKDQAPAIFSWSMATQSFLIVVMHLGIGSLSDKLGIKVAFHFCLVFLVISALCLWRSEVEKRKI